MLTDQAIHDAVSRIVAAARQPSRVIVFGSYARGDANEGSDLDVLVVEKEIPDYTQEYVRLRDAIGSVGVGIDLLLTTQSEFEQRRQWWTTPLYWADREGKVLYESAG
ncbi:MAG: nucleotidyltransferase domain-containing protein [Betaproteobacteria bacterium]|nr:nucleotidyltransferase domain-containing protein [Betaproteobacteria bacterium]